MFPVCEGQVRPGHCELDPDPGDCDGVCERWYYNSRNRECQTFQWGCCGGNSNNYETSIECYRGCASKGYKIKPIIV